MAGIFFDCDFKFGGRWEADMKTWRILLRWFFSVGEVGVFRIHPSTICQCSDLPVFDGVIFFF